ncbi:ArnT family glycosyltransferase [Fusobacterium nucleatum]|uniref:Dolichyl-phosphate-mannose-protein mannosyltransferase n=1 Tax=Fusobacterium nucleatum TaxID=851 RepID=A0A133NV90_FUSNU|nr:glycosyltransferase family 39 protein [Fusobacterium nucleatum]KXA20185.1 dolichyl-phosphate-mannose-protein mannosyltransferase [Fusobacterium nucleatum]
MLSSNKKDIFILLSLSIFAFLSVIWVNEVDIMEARNFITAREMLKNSDWWTTTLNGQLRFEKPPFPTWLTAFTMMLFHSKSESILRIPNILVSIFTILFLYISIIRIKKDKLFAFLSSFVLLTTFMFIKTGAENTWDIYTYAFAFCASLSLYIYMQENLKKDLFLTIIFLILSFLSKGPVGFYAIFIPFIIAYLFTNPKEKWKGKIKFIFLAVIVAFAISSIWAISMYFNHSNYFLEIMKKESLTWSTKHSRSIFFYLDYFVYMGSWIFFSVFVFFKSPKNKEDKIFYIWNIISLIFISVIQMKKKRYGLPIYLISSLNIAQLCVYYFRTPYENLKKIEKFLLRFQQYFIMFVIFLSLGFLVYFGYIKKEISFILFLLYVFIHIIFLILINVKYTKNNYAERIILFSGLAMLVLNFSSSWVLESNFIKDKMLKFRVPVSQEVIANNFSIYSNDFDIEEVWRIGKNIKELVNIPMEKEIFYLGGKEPENLMKVYKIIKIYKYQKINHKMDNLYYLERK